MGEFMLSKYEFRTTFARRISLYGFAVLFLAFGCSGNRSISRRQSRLLVPAGVDSTVAMRADTLAEGLFVSIERENRANQLKVIGKSRTSQSDTLWKYLSNDLGPDFEVTAENEARAVESFNAGARNLQELSQLGDSSQDANTRMKSQSLLLAAKKNFERAVMLNPFDLEAKSWLARVYQTMAARFLDEDNHKRAVQVLENLLRLERGEHSLYARLGEAYYALEDWPDAYHNFAMAESVLRSAAGLDFDATSEPVQDATPDSATLFYYVYYQGDTEIKMHQADRGLRSLTRALTYASTDQERADVQSYIDWVNWDDGNTRAVVLRDKYVALQEEGKYKEAASGFLKLVQQLRTRRAIDETIWRLAVLEFQHLKRQNKGIDRLKNVIKLAAKDSRGAPLDSSYRKYFDSYGVMCHNLGLANIKKNRKFAFIYFQQAAAVAWKNRAKSHLEIAKLSRNSAKAVLHNCENALAQPEQLDANEQMQAYQLMVEALKRSGRFDEARKYYSKWVQMRNSGRRVGR